MSVTQTVDIPASHRLVIDVPHEVPEGPVILTFTPVADKVSANTVAETSPPYAEEHTHTHNTVAETSPPYAEEHTHTHPCPICAAHLDPVTGNPRYKPEVYEGMQEADDMLSGKIPSTLRRFNSFEEMWEDLMRDD
ncbi:MAG: hypothetical protein FWF55_07025 [Treponema sp.]|nr:hypothetical protein [Treponema sp.]